MQMPTQKSIRVNFLEYGIAMNKLNVEIHLLRF